MNSAYLFRVGVLSFIINIQESGIGYAYPRIFVRFPDDSYLNFDLTVGGIFKMTAKDWDSWLDGTEERLDTIDEVENLCREHGMNWKIFEEMVFKMYEDNK